MPHRRTTLALAVLTAICAMARPGAAPSADGPDPWFGTFSIIAFDPGTQELGVGVQSRAFGAGAAVPYAKPGVGAVATQASANRQYARKRSRSSNRGCHPPRSSSASPTKTPAATAAKWR